MKNQKRIVCLGGGIGTVNLIKGLKEYTDEITVVVSMADDGGSAGRLRRMYNIQPPGDLVSCMAAMSENKNPFLASLLKYRFPGDRYSKDDCLAGHKLGNLIMVAIRNMTGDMDETISQFQKLFRVPGTFLPATEEQVTLCAKTTDGRIIEGEETIDLGKYEGERVIEEIYIGPKDVKAHKKVIEKLKQADCIIAGPGDLYTNILPVLIIKEIKEALKQSKTDSAFIVNVANKPFETKGYFVEDFVKAITKHLGFFPFKKVVINSNHTLPIPEMYDYQYVDQKNKDLDSSITLINKDLVEPKFPLYHNPQKLAKAIWEHI